MAFLVEDGTGIASANSYGDIPDAQTYFGDRGRLAEWNGTDTSTTITAADAGADTLTAAAHPFETGDGPVTFTGSDLPDGLALLTEYWLVVSDASTLQVATTYALAVAAVPTVIDLVDVGSGTMTIVHPDFDDQRAAFVKATDYVELLYSARYRGVRSTAAQGLEWPRSVAYDKLGDLMTLVPAALLYAVCEYAIRARSASLLADDTDASASAKNRSVAGVSYSTSYSGAKKVSYPAADRLMRTVTRKALTQRA